MQTNCTIFCLFSSFYRNNTFALIFSPAINMNFTRAISSLNLKTRSISVGCYKTKQLECLLQNNRITFHRMFLPSVYYVQGTLSFSLTLLLAYLILKYTPPAMKNYGALIFNALLCDLVLSITDSLSVAE